MYIVYLHHESYLNDTDIETSVPILPEVNDWIEVPSDIRQSHWPNATDTLCVIEREYIFDESMKFCGVRLYLQDWEGK